MWDLSVYCGSFVRRERCLSNLQGRVVLSSSDRLWPGPHYAATLPIDLPGAKVMGASQSIQRHDLSYSPMSIDC